MIKRSPNGRHNVCSTFSDDYDDDERCYDDDDDEDDDDDDAAAAGDDDDDDDADDDGGDDDDDKSVSISYKAFRKLCTSLNDWSLKSFKKTF